MKFKIKMSRWINLRNRLNSFVNVLNEKKNEAEAHRFEEFHAAVKIQSCARGFIVRQQIKYFNYCATTVQRHWRGFIDRRKVRGLLKIAVYEMQLKHFNRMATVIQKWWKGYYIRNYIFSFYERKKYLEHVQAQNEKILQELQNYTEEMKEGDKRMLEEVEHDEAVKWAEKHHYLVSTKAQPGVYNSPFKMDPLPQELLLRTVKPRTVIPKEQAANKNFDPAWLSYSSEVPEKLPPLPQKPQGPFKDPKEVQVQRYKPFRPSLRVVTKFDSVEEAREALKREEWTQRLHDEVFKHGISTNKPYDPMICCQGPFEQLEYGRKYFREDKKPKIRFKSVLPPINTFDKLNLEYIEGFAGK